jgi:isopenicillin N synthase-like dioxygenase
MGVMKNEKGKPDRCEFFNVGQDEILGNEPRRENPKPVQENWEVFASFLQNASSVIQLILGILDMQLGLPKGSLASLQRTDQASGTTVRMIRYPPKSVHDQGSSLLGHTDYGSITMLCNVLGGLQILPPGASNEDANWQYVKPEPNCVIINLGDALVEWTGDILRSNEHRVIAPPGKQADYARFSIVYLVRPERKVSMKRLIGGIIPSAAEDGKEELSFTAEEWEMRKAMALKAGADCARSRGGREIEALPLKVS